MSKLGLTLIAITAVSVAVAMQAYNIQTADAQAKLPNNSVRSETIVDGEVKTQDLDRDAITLNTVMRTESALVLGPGQYGTSEASCRTGEILTGGGFAVGTANSSNNLEQVVIIRSTADSSTNPDTWQAIAYNNGPDNGAVTAYAMCATLSP